MFSRSKTALSGSPPFPVADPKEVLTYMQVLTMECVTGVEVSASGIIHAVRIEAGALPQENATIARYKAALVRWGFAMPWLHQPANEFDRTAVLKNSRRTTSHSRRPRTKQIRAHV